MKDKQPKPTTEPEKTEAAKQELTFFEKELGEYSPISDKIEREINDLINTTIPPMRQQLNDWFETLNTGAAAHGKLLRSGPDIDREIQAGIALGDDTRIAAGTAKKRNLIGDCEAAGERLLEIANAPAIQELSKNFKAKSEGLAAKAARLNSLSRRIQQLAATFYAYSQDLDNNAKESGLKNLQVKRLVEQHPAASVNQKLIKIDKIGYGNPHKNTAGMIDTGRCPKCSASAGVARPDGSFKCRCGCQWSLESVA